MIIAGAILWWLGNRALEEQAATQKREQLGALEVELGRQELLGLNLQAVSSTTLDIATRAIEEKGAPLARLEPQTMSQRTYGYTDLVLTSGSEISRTIYQRGLYQALDAYSRGLTGNELTQLNNYFASADPTELEPIMASYRNLDRALAALAALRVPAEATLPHLQLLNSVASLRQVIYNMSEAEREPLLASESAELRTEYYNALLLAISNIDRYLQYPDAP